MVLGGPSSHMGLGRLAAEGRACGGQARKSVPLEKGVKCEVEVEAADGNRQKTTAKRDLQSDVPSCTGACRVAASASLSNRRNG